MSKSFKLLQQGEHPDAPSTSTSPDVIDWTRCIFCQKTTKEALQCPKDSKRSTSTDTDTYSNLANNLQRFHELGRLSDSVNLAGLDDGSGVATTLRSNEAKWHKNCKDAYNSTKLNRIEKMKRQNEDSEKPNTSPKKIVTRRSSGHAAKTTQDTCFFCGEPGYLHKASTEKLDRNVRKCAEAVKDYILIGKLSDGDMVSQDAMYHGNCLKSLYRKAEVAHQSTDKDNTYKQLHGIALAELLSYIQECRTESIESSTAPVFKLADLTEMYSARLRNLGADMTARVNSTRLKERILANIPDLEAHKQGRDVLLVFKDDVGLALKKALESDFDEEAIVLARAADIVRRDILRHEKSAFNGSFSKECQQQSVPQSLMTIIGMIMTGTNIVQQSSNATDTQAMLSVSQLVRHNVIIRRRVGSTSHYHSVDREPPLPIYVALLIHARTRKRILIDKMYDLGISVSYDRVLSISKDLGNDVIARYEAEQVVCPTTLRHGLFTTSAVDNIDHNPTSATAQGAFHGTGISIFQHPTKELHGEDRKLTASSPKQKSMATLPEEYTNIQSATFHTKEPEVPDATDLPPVTSDAISAAFQDDERWLSHVQEVVDSEDNPNQDMEVSWAAFHASRTNPDPETPTDVSSLLPLFPEKASSPAMIRHAMDVIKQDIDFLNPGQTPVLAFDQPLYALAKQIQWNWPNTYGEDKMVVMFGGLHIEMAAFRTIGDWLEESGWTSALVEAEIASPGTADSFLKAAHLTRTRHVHQVTASTLYILMKRSYEKYSVNLTATEVQEEFEVWRKRCVEESPQFHYWSLTLDFQLTILSFVKSLREGNFQLYIEAIDNLLPWFFALDHPHYSRWLPVHLRDMMNLKHTHPTVAAQFEEGKFVIKKTHRTFSAIALDHAHEQNNSIVKGDGGAIGLTENSTQLMRWMVAGPEMARVIGEFEESVDSLKQKQSQGPDVKHHEQVKSVQGTFEKQVKSLCRTIEEMGNPFEEESGDLLVIDSKDVVADSVVSTVRTIQHLGKEQYSRFVESRLHNKTESLFSPVKRNKLSLFSCPQTANKSDDKQQIASLKKTCDLFSRLYVSCQVRDGNLEEFFRHENQTYPPSLSKFGEIRSGTKADLLECLQDVNEAPSDSSPDVDAILLDGAAIINILKPGTAKTFSEYSEHVFLPYIQSHLQKANRVDIIWDEYIQDSLKASARKKRGKGTRRRVQPNTKIPGNWQSFLRIDENKKELFAYLAQESVKIQSEGKIISTFGKLILLNNPTADTSRLSPCTHEEADTRLLLHAADAATDGCLRVMLRTVDTDVVTLCIALFTQLNLSEVWILFGTGKSRRLIPAHAIAQTLGPKRAISMLMFHSFTGCDQTSFFLNRGKKTAWNTSKVFTEIHDAFEVLSRMPPSEQQLQDQMPVIERFVVLMYDKTSSCSSVDEARCELFTQKGRSIEFIPPTSAALLQHAKRATFQASYVWGQSLLRVPELPDPADWGWTKSNSTFWQPLWTTLPEACKSCQELIKCGCKSNRGCLGRCKCVKAGVACTSYCGCHGDCERQL